MIQISNNKNIDKVLLKETILICRDNADITHSVIADFLTLKIKNDNLLKIYFIQPRLEVLKYLEEVANEEDYQAVNNFTDIDVRQFNLILVGLKVGDTKVVTKLKGLKNETLAIFKEDNQLLSIWRQSIKHLTILLEDSHEIARLNQITSEPPLDKNIGSFYNRGLELEKYERFRANNEKRACQIVGMYGIGKQAFIAFLRKDRGFSNYHFEYKFKSKSENLTDVLNYLFSKLSSNFTEEEIQSINLQSGDKKYDIERMLKRFDGLNNASIVFLDVEKIYDFDRRDFFDSGLSRFFKILIHRTSFKGNKVYFVSNEDWSFKIEEQELVTKIKLGSLNAKNIRLIIGQVFTTSEKNLYPYSVSIKNETLYTDEVIDKLVHGHPYIAKLFATVAEDWGLEQIINDLETREGFEKEKINYLIEKIKVDENEKILLNHLVLFSHKIEIEYLKKIIPSTDDLSLSLLNTLRHLKGRFLIEADHFENGDITYYVSPLIKRYIISQLSKKALKQNHEAIGDFYKDVLAVKIYKNNGKNIIGAYSNALYHFEEAENKQKVKGLIGRFKNRFINDAQKYYNNNKFEEAWNYYNELYISDKDSLDNKHLNFYLTCCYKLDKEGIEEIFTEANQRYANDKFIRNTYLNFLEYQKRYSEIINIYDGIKKDKKLPYDYVLETTYATTLSKIGREKEAIHLMEEVIKKEKEGENVINSLKKHYMSLYSILNEIFLFKKITEFYIKNNKNTFVFKSLLPIDVQNEIENVFRIIKNHPWCEHKKIEKSHNEFVKNSSNYYINQNDLEFDYSITNENFDYYLDIYSKRVDLGNSILEDVLKLESNNYPALVAKSSFLQRKARFDMLVNDLQRKTPSLIVYVEGETDVQYLEKALEIFKLYRLSIEIKCVGVKDGVNVKGAGDTALEKYWQANRFKTDNLKTKTLLLFDADTKREEESSGNLYIHCMPKNDENKLYERGIENLLTLPLDFPKDNFYRITEIPPKADGYGGGTKTTKIDLKKKDLSNWICQSLSLEEQIYYLKKFEDVLKKWKIIVE